MTTNSKTTNWPGRILTAFVTLALLGSAIAKAAGVPKMVDGLIHAGIPRAAILPISALELCCLALFLVPRTAVLGTLLLTGYMGGATVTHLIAGESLVPPLMVGLIAWVAAYLRVPEFQELLPLHKLDAGRNAALATRS